MMEILPFNDHNDDDVEMNLGAYKNHSNNTTTRAQIKYSKLNMQGKKKEDKDGKITFNGILQISYLEQYRDNFEKKWLPAMIEVIRSWKGYQHHRLHVIHNPIHTDVIECVFIFSFTSLESYRSWCISDERKQLLHDATSLNLNIKVLNDFGSNDAKCTRISLQNFSKTPALPLPPPKWKMILVIYVTLMTALLVLEYSGLAVIMLEAGIPSFLVTFINLIHSVFILSYSITSIFMSIPLVDKWVKAPRDIATMWPIFRIIDSGFQIFSVDSGSSLFEDAKAKINKVEEKLDSLRKVNFELRQEIKQIRNRLSLLEPNLNVIYETEENTPLVKQDSVRDLFSRRNSEKTLGSPKVVQDDASVTVAVVNVIKWEYRLEYESWAQEMNEAMSQFEGFLGLTVFQEEGVEGVFIHSFCFDTFEHMSKFVNSPERLALVQRLDPMLAGTTTAEINYERTLNSAFSEISVPTGETISLKPPPIWKTSCLVFAPLYFIILLAIEVVAWRMKNLYVSLFVTTFITVSVNTYLGVPLVSYLFGEWLKLPYSTDKFFSYLNIGFPVWMQYVMAVIYYAIFIVLGFAKSV